MNKYNSFKDIRDAGLKGMREETVENPNRACLIHGIGVVVFSYGFVFIIATIADRIITLFLSL